jgi:MFS family permease
MAATEATKHEHVTVASKRSSRPDWASPWVVIGFALLLLLVLGYRFLGDPSLSAPTRDPAWYTWRAQVVMESNPGSVAGEWGPIINNSGLFSGGYRVTTLVAGAMLQRVAGIDRYSFSAFLMLGVPVLTGLALGAGAYRSRRDGLVVLLTMLATAALFLTTTYVGYLDNITVLFLLALIFPFLDAARTSWGARSAVFLIGIAAAFTHPTTCVLFGATMLAVFGFHFLTSRVHLSEALKRDAPALMSVGFGMIAGLACWVVGIWGTTASINDAALPPPYTKRFFLDRLGEWILSMQPEIIVPLIAVAIGSTILLARRERKPADAYDVTAVWWLLPLLGVFTFFAGTDFQVAGDPGSPVVPYYRFMNATAAPMALAGLGAFVLVRWLWQGNGARLLAGVLGALVVIGSLGWMFAYGTRPSNWVSDETQWANQEVRSSLAAVHEVVAAAGERPNVLIMNYNDTADETGTNTAYGWAKTYTNVFRTGLPGASAKYSVTYLGTIQNFLARQPTTGASPGYDRAAGLHFDEVRSRLATYTEPPVVFVIGQYYKGVCNGGACGDDPSTAPQVFHQALEQADAVEVGPDVYALTAPGLWSPPDDVVSRAHDDAVAAAAAFEDHPSAWANPLHTLRVLLGLFVLVVLPGFLARRFFEIDDSPVATVALVPGMSIVLTLLSGIAVLAVWRGPLTTTKGWAVAAAAVGLGAALGYGKARVLRPLEAMGSFFDRMFAVFSNRDFSVLMGVQFMAQAGQGVVQGAIAKSLAFGGEKGFDVQNLPSARYLLVVVLLLYGPYTLISPFIGVFIDRFPRRRVVWWADVITAVLVIAVAVGVLLPLGKGTTEGRWFDTGALIVGLLAVQACVRVALAVKSAAIPDVLSGRDLLQGNGLSQAGGALFQILGIVVGGGLAGFVHPWVPAVVGAGVLAAAAAVAMQLHHAEVRAHAASFATEASQVLRNIRAGVREVAARPAAALGLSSFQMLRYQFWGFGLFVFGLYAKNLVSSGDSNTLSLVLSGLGGLLGGALGLVVAQTYKDRVAPVRLLLGSMALLGVGTLVGGAFISVAGFALMLFIGFFSFFVGKISADTIMQQTMPDDFRGRAFALFDIAYNLGYIVPALILFAVWVDGSVATTRTILLVSGVVFLGLTFLVAGWARRIRDQFAPQDDLVATEQGPE